MYYNHLSQYQRKIKCSVEELVKVIEKLIRPFVKKHQIFPQIKSLETLEKKMCLRKSKSIFEIKDVYRFRILVTSIDEIYTISKLILQKFEGYLDHDYIKNPKTRKDVPSLKGKSLKLLQIIVYKNKVPFEVQITTFKFNESNELLHKRYHKEKYP